MYRHIYNAVHAPKKILRTTWNAVSGNTIMLSRGMWPNYTLQTVGTAIGGFVGIFPGMVVGEHNHSFLLGAATWAAVVSAPTLLLHLPYAIYKAGEYDNYYHQIEQQNKKRLEAQQRKALPAPDSKLI